MNWSIVSDHQARDFMRSLDVRTLLAQSHLNRSWSPVDEIGHLSFPDPLKRLVNLSGIDLSLNDVQNWHVLSFSRWSTDHDVVGMEQSSHDVQHSGFSDVWHLSFDGQWSVSGHQKVASWSWDQWGHQTNHVVIHVAWVSQGCGWGGHDSWHDWVDLGKVWVADLQPINCDFVKGLIVKHNDRIWIVDESFQRKDWVVGLDDYIRRFGLIGEHWVRRNDFFRVLIVELFEEITSQTASCSTCDWMENQKSFKRLGAIGLTIDHVDDFLLEFFSLGVAAGPTVTSTTSLLGNENIFGIVQVWIWARLNCIDDLELSRKILSVTNQ